MRGPVERCCQTHTLAQCRSLRSGLRRLLTTGTNSRHTLTESRSKGTTCDGNTGCEVNQSSVHQGMHNLLVVQHRQLEQPRTHHTQRLCGNKRTYGVQMMRTPHAPRYYFSLPALSQLATEPPPTLFGTRSPPPFFAQLTTHSPETTYTRHSAYSV